MWMPRHAIRFTLLILFVLQYILLVDTSLLGGRYWGFSAEKVSLFFVSSLSSLVESVMPFTSDVGPVVEKESFTENDIVRIGRQANDNRHWRQNEGSRK
ncbi:hypothetical protein AVEN_85691-1 [Araneus ventricosus]|uniref:Uncharacterized protein n=1 Tax=Araneus ventricosus TaxID=182803 RepID=A0A4Y2R7C8_ARAVE|nr:hypothetical protein AVEN_85691-1 [Araneus ventricosus]